MSSSYRGMAKDYCPEKGDGSGSNGCGIGGTKVPKFFKIVTNPGEQRLTLPPEFTRKYGHNLPDCVSLNVPNGLVWKVEVIHSNKETWLNGGWQRFKEYYSIELGHFLVFKYVGREHFDVHVFDSTTATEIDYCYYDSLRKDLGKSPLLATTEGVESDSDDSVVFLRAGKSVGRKHQDDDDDDIDEHSGGTKLKYTERKRGQNRASDGNKRFETYKRASIFMSNKPTKTPFSIVVMHPSYVRTQRWPCLHIPSAFFNGILSSKVNSSILLVSEGKTWPVRYTIGKHQVSLSTGWGKFVEDNYLKEGDACVFEVCDRIKLTCNVIIFRA